MSKFAILRNVCGAALAALALAVPAVSRAQSVYSVVDLGASVAGDSNGFGINNSGQVTGHHTSPSGLDYLALRWTGTTAVELDNLGGADSTGTGINASGQVAGFAYTTNFVTYHAVRWTGTAAVDLGMGCPRYFSPAKMLVSVWL